MAAYAIDKAIPLVNASSRKSYPFGEMDIGDSCLIDDVADRNTVQSAASYYGTRHGTKFTVRKVDGGFRVWRVA